MRDQCDGMRRCVGVDNLIREGKKKNVDKEKWKHTKSKERR